MAERLPPVVFAPFELGGSLLPFACTNTFWNKPQLNFAAWKEEACLTRIVVSAVFSALSVWIPPSPKRTDL